MPRSDLNPTEQEHVRTLLRMLRVKLGGWPSVQRALPMSGNSLWHAVSGRTEVSATLAFRVARLLDASISQVLTGQALPAGTCKHCGHAIEDKAC
jgi:hypothetical protein